MQRIEIMRPGTWRAMGGQDVSFSEDQLRVAAVAYDAAKAPAPVVIGHPTVEAPAYGWVKALDFAEGVLGAYVGDLEPGFAEAVKAKRYNKVSASFFLPQAPANPRPGLVYLRHVGFLGAAAPAVSGLKPVSFAADDDAVLSFAHDADAFGIADAEASTYGRALSRIAELEAKAREHQQRDLASFCTELEKQGRLVPGLRNLALALLSGASADAVVSFGEGKTAQTLPQREALMKFLSLMPPVIAFGEIAGGSGPFAGGGEAAMQMPEGYTADPDREALARRAEALASKQQISFAEAVRTLSRGAGR